MTRQDAEDLLSTKPPGTYLIRLSDRIWGYALSYRGDSKCKHYLIDASDGGYRFFGTNQAKHRSLHDLVECHKVISIPLAALHTPEFADINRSLSYVFNPRTDTDSND